MTFTITTFPIGRLLAAAAVIAGAGLLSACEKQVEAPYDTGICWHAIPLKNGAIKFNKLASNVPNMETCAAELEGMRIRFARLAMASSSREMLGAYQGNFLFLDARGVSVAPNLTKARYVALVRTGDGRLAIPGAIRRQMQVSGAPDPATAK
jgi:hypothetical protein